ncbi:putative adhesin [Endozoicomonas sp. NE40]|uniref:Putative adhesin Stv domain-containing protein n=1 Tax=Endozoicomonas lisbonensis TaxID=3120522 RepID=A0ABV2SMM5_9GAMM
MPFFKPKVKTSNPSEALKLFTCNRLAGRSVENLILYCHGGYEQMSPSMSNPSRDRKFTVPPWVSIYFYAPHGTEMYSDLYRFMRGSYEPYIIYTSNEVCFDYTLARMEEYSGSKRFIKQTFLDYRSSLGKSDLKRPSRLFDILCPTDNWFIRLSAVLDIMKDQKKLSGYRKVHCLFCRSIVFSPSQSPACSADVQPLSHLPFYDPTRQLPPNIYQSDSGRWLITDIDVIDMPDTEG